MNRLSRFIITRGVIDMATSAILHSEGYIYDGAVSGAKSIQEHIRDLENTRAAKAARQDAIHQKSVDEGRSMDEKETIEFDEIDAEINQIDADLVRSKKLEQRNVSRATPVTGDNPAPGVRVVRAVTGSPAIIINPREATPAFKGHQYMMMVISKVLAQRHSVPASAIAATRFKMFPKVVEIIKANEVPGGGTGAGEWGHELVSINNQFAGDFLELLQAATVYDKLPFREIPRNVLIKGQDGAATAYWVGESKGIPASRPTFFNVTMTALKVAALAVMSNELIEDSSPAALQLVQQALIDASAQRLDTTLFSASAASAGVSPAGLLNGLTPLVSAGNDAEGVRDDVSALYAPFFAGKNASNIWFVMNPATAKIIQLMVTPLGTTVFTGITANGGSLLGDNVVTGDNIPAADLIAIRPSDIYKIGDSGVEVALSRETMIEQNSVPTGATDTPVAASATLTSMFQEDSTALRIVRRINFAKRRSDAVAYINDAAYGVES